MLGCSVQCDGYIDLVGMLLWVIPVDVLWYLESKQSTWQAKQFRNRSPKIEDAVELSSFERPNTHTICPLQQHHRHRHASHIFTRPLTQR